MTAADLCSDGTFETPEFREWLASLPKSTIRYKDEYASHGECTRCFSLRESQSHIKGSPGYMHEYEHVAGAGGTP